MMRFTLTAIAGLFGFGLLLVNGSAQAAGDAAKGADVFKKCMACHTLEAGKNKVGPSLGGVIGRKAGTVAGFSYSDAMKNSGLTWDDATLTKYLANPKALVAGTRMSFVGLPKPEDIENLLAYMKANGGAAK